MLTLGLKLRLLPSEIDIQGMEGLGLRIAPWLSGSGFRADSVILGAA